jgi:hypothetical protein
MSRFTDLAYDTDRFSHPLSQEMFPPPERHPRMSDSGMYCVTCGKELKVIEYPDEPEEYCGGSYTVYGGSELFCEKGCPA